MPERLRCTISPLHALSFPLFLSRRSFQTFPNYNRNGSQDLQCCRHRLWHVRKGGQRPVQPSAYNSTDDLHAQVFHIPLILAVPAFKLYGIVQRSPKPSDDASKDHPGTKSWRSVDEMYSDSAVDVVVVTTIPETHFDFTKRALESGKHVVVEKPFVPTSKEADELIAIAKKSGKLLTVYQNRRWDSDYLTLSSILNEGTLGDLAEFETHFDRHRPGAPPDTSREAWKGADLPGHGAAYDLGTHLIDQVYHSFGAPKRVTGFIGDQRRGKKGGSPDSCTVLMHYDGMLVTVKAGIISPEVEQLRYWVRGTKGSFKKV